MNIDYHATQRKNVGFYEIRDSIRDRPARVSGERTIHIDTIERRDPGIRNASAFAELRDQNDPAGHVRRIQVAAQSFDGDLPFVFVAVRSAETQDAVWIAASCAIDDGQGNKRITPGPIQMKSDLVIVFARPIEIDGGRVVDNDGITV